MVQQTNLLKCILQPHLCEADHSFGLLGCWKLQMNFGVNGEQDAKALARAIDAGIHL